MSPKCCGKAQATGTSNRCRTCVDAEAFLSHLARNENATPAEQAQAGEAISFFHLARMAKVASVNWKKRTFFQKGSYKPPIFRRG
jgi:hypothetical protein